MKSQTNNNDMSATDQKIDALLDELSKDILEHTNASCGAIRMLEMFNTSPDDFKKGCTQLAHNTFILGYLTRIEAVVKSRDLKKCENIIRFHSYQQHTKGNLSDGQDISVAQAAVVMILDRYIKKFFTQPLPSQTTYQ